MLRLSQNFHRILFRRNYAALIILLSIMFSGLSADASRERSSVFKLYIVTSIAGSGAGGARDGVDAGAEFKWPTGVSVGKASLHSSGQTLYVADFLNNLIRKISPKKRVTTFAGSVEGGFSDGRGEDALFSGPDNISSSPDGTLYVADSNNFAIRRISPDGTVSTVAGGSGKGYRDGEAGEALFGYPTSVVPDGKGNLYVADRGTNTIRKIGPDGEVTTVAGNGESGFKDGRGTKSRLNDPLTVAMGKDGSVYIADSGNNSIRRLTPDGELTTVAGRIEAGFKDGAGIDALFNWPTGIAVGPGGNVFICDSRNNRIRRMTPSGVVTTIAGASIKGGFRDGTGRASLFNFPTGIDVAPDGTIYIADSGNNLIRKIEYKSIGYAMGVRGTESVSSTRLW